MGIPYVYYYLLFYVLISMELCNMMWSLFVFIQVGSSSIWSVTQLYDTACCTVLLAVTAFHGPCVPMPWRLPCWRVTHLSQLFISRFTVEVTPKCYRCETNLTCTLYMWLAGWFRYRMLSFADPTGKRTAWVSLRNCLYLLPLGLFAYNCKY